ncbi:MAG: phosphoethanolamine--lipid A transferase EptA [Paludibacter sp.]|nr:phosphoethanolamine--lipid A transferase EptA [Paludibacter sp.]
MPFVSKVQHYLSVLKNDVKLMYFALVMSLVNLLFFHVPFYKFVVHNVDCQTLNGLVIIVSLVIVMLVANFFVFYLLLFLFRIVGKWILALSFLLNSIALYFINTYSVIMDESMIGNVFNTNYAEATGFFSIKLIWYVLLLGVVPTIYIFKAKIIHGTWKKFLTTSSLTLLLVLILVFANARNWLWIDKNSKVLGGLAMPWSYSVNAALYQTHKHKANQEEILLPNATIKDNEKSIVVLVIGESARRGNFSLYGYKRNTNPLLSKTPNLFTFNAISDATYTTASVKSILEYKPTSDLYELLPNYLYRNGVEVIWRTSNWGEPPIHIKYYQPEKELKAKCQGEKCDYDEVLLTGLKEQILASNKNKLFIVLHTSTSHGPQYSKKYPAQFGVFQPVCNSVELSKCSHDELINAYDNTIVYTDYLLSQVIADLKALKQYHCTMIYVSDHGESLGEKNLYMHGVPMSLAPREQYEIPFIVWTSDDSKSLKPNKELTQHYVFHSVLNFLGIQSPIYDETMSIFK